MLAALRQGDRHSVMAVWKEIAPLEKLRTSHHSGNNVTVIKEAMNLLGLPDGDRKSTRLNSSHANISYAVFCLKKKKTIQHLTHLAIPPLSLDPSHRPRQHHRVSTPALKRRLPHFRYRHRSHVIYRLDQTSHSP